MPIGSAREGQSECPEQLRSALRSKHRAWLRTNQLRDLGYTSYAAYLRSPHWQSIRGRYKDSDRPQRCMCGAEKRSSSSHDLRPDRPGRTDRLDRSVPEVPRRRTHARTSRRDRTRLHGPGITGAGSEVPSRNCACTAAGSHSGRTSRSSRARPHTEGQAEADRFPCLRARGRHPR